eukprot:gene6872-9413_t
MCVDEVDVFISFRFSEAVNEAKILKRELQLHNIKVFLCDVVKVGEDLQTKISEPLASSKVQVLLATKTYGLKTNSLFSTRQEMNHSILYGNPFLVKMCDRWSVPATRLALDTLLYKNWAPGSEISQELVVAIVDLVQPKPNVNVNVTQSNSQQQSMKSERFWKVWKLLMIFVLILIIAATKVAFNFGVVAKFIFIIIHFSKMKTSSAFWWIIGLLTSLVLMVTLLFGYYMKRNGHQSIRYANGDVYEGAYMNDKRHGRGIYRFANGDVYQGQFKDDMKDGLGIFRNANGDEYQGDFRDDKRHGRGTFRNAQNGDVYEGDYKNNEKHGNGVYRYGNGDIYEGDYYRNKKNGRGTFGFANGDVYVGEYQDNKMHGLGIFRFANGNIHDGEYKENKKNGRGKLHYANGDLYDGEFKDGSINGHGIYRFANGNEYERENFTDDTNVHLDMQVLDVDNGYEVIIIIVVNLVVQTE